LGKVEPFAPARSKRPSNRQYRRKPGRGRKPMAVRTVFEAIVYMLHIGCQWKALP
jgi:transposase